ncbi:MAG: carbohydrate kinase family protein [Thermoflexales bacterium]|nr:carbohydrate kinase family protein [Thermoflexales bacterium]
MNESILVIGCASLDTLHIGGHTYQTIGGAGLYTALAAQCAGAQATLLGPRPKPLPASLAPVARRLHWIGPEVPPELLPRLEIAHHGEGRATLVGASWGAEAQLTTEHLPDDLSPYAFVHIAALSSAHKMLDFLHACRARGAQRISAGTYYRIVQNEPATVRAIFEQADLFFMNENEAIGLWGSLRVAGRVALRTRAGALLFITFDRRGAIVVAGDQATPLPADPANELDPTGAGDTFCGATLAGLARGEDAVTAASRATVLAARKIEHVGPAFLLGLPALK